MRRYSEWFLVNFFNLPGKKKYTPHPKHADSYKNAKDISGFFHSLALTLINKYNYHTRYQKKF